MLPLKGTLLHWHTGTMSAKLDIKEAIIMLKSHYCKSILQNNAAFLQILNIQSYK